METVVSVHYIEYQPAMDGNSDSADSVAQREDQGSTEVTIL